MKQLLLSILFTFFTFSSLTAQPASLYNQTQVSLLTMGPGDQLYDAFGHSALRIKDPNLGFDVTYNYGVYDFSDPNFYTKFARGKLLYLLVRRDTDSFIESYKNQQRWVKEQVLNLTPAQTKDLFNFLENNAKPENRGYQYDFFYDNCATKIPQVIEKATGYKFLLDNSFVQNPKTFRTLVQDNVHWNSWGSFGMDLALGSVTDVTASREQHMFLPFYVYDAFDLATLKGDNTPPIRLSSEHTTLFEAPDKQLKSSFFVSPFFVFLILGLLIIVVTYVDYKKAKRSRYLDVAIFLVTGIAGIILMLLWFATEHTTTVNNYDLLWAFPFNIFVLIQAAKKNPKKWFGRYLRFLIILLALMCMHWIIGVQIFAKALIPLLIALLVRYVYLIRFIGLLPAVEDNGA
jgi:hypothetical protein